MVLLYTFVTLLPDTLLQISIEYDQCNPFLSWTYRLLLVMMVLLMMLNTVGIGTRKHGVQTSA